MRHFKFSLSKIAAFSLVALPTLYVLFISAPYLGQYFARIPFDSERWIEWQETENECCTRWRMARNLTNQHDLVSMNRLEVIELLGEPDYEDESVLNYYLGMTGHGIDTGLLRLDLNQKGEVESYEISRG